MYKEELMGQNTIFLNVFDIILNWKFFKIYSKKKYKELNLNEQCFNEIARFWIRMCACVCVVYV